MYSGIACFVLFDARGGDEILPIHLISAAIFSAIVMLAVKYIPVIFHRPQLLVDSFCNDVLAIGAHAMAAALIQDPILRHGCALHSACFCLQGRFKNHAVVGCFLLLGAYFYGPRITDVRRFALSVSFPHVVELLARVLEIGHRLLVLSAKQL